MTTYNIELAKNIEHYEFQNLLNQMIQRIEPKQLNLYYEKTLLLLKRLPEIKISRGFDYANTSITCPKCGTKQQLKDLTHKPNSRNCSVCIFPILTW